MAFVLLVVVGAVGGAVDLSNAMSQRIIAQRDLDIALISTLRGKNREDITQEEREKLVRQYMSETFNDFPADAEINVTKDGDVYSATISFEKKNILLKAVGFSAFEINVASSVTLGPPRPTELALVLDTTGSMASGDKMTTMQAAARNLVSSLTDQSDNVRISLVPFATHINVGTANRMATGLDIPNDIPPEQQCTTTPDMEQTNCREVDSTCSNQSCSTNSGTCTSDGVSYSCPQTECQVTSTYQCKETVCDSTPTGTSTTQCSMTNGREWKGCVGSREHPHNTRDTIAGGLIPGFLAGSCAQPITRLTGDTSSILTAIDSFTPSGETFIAPALLWGARTISATTPFPDGTADNPDMYKAIILMSDGANTISKNDEEITHKGTDRAASDDLFREVCENIKEAGIDIYTVAYGINDSNGRALLEECATDQSTMFFDARTDAQLSESFLTITNGLRTVTVTK